MEDFEGTIELARKVTFPGGWWHALGRVVTCCCFWGRSVRRLFYLVGINETSFHPDAKQPDFVPESVPFFTGFIVLEALVLWYKGRMPLRISDGVMSMVAGLFSYLPQLFLRAISIVAYSYVFEHWRLVTLPWDSPWTWILCMFGVDFGYYWFHRMAHEINLFWAAHQVHHSSEDYNLSTALRQSILQGYTSWMFYLPMALCIPPNVFLVHTQLNLIYQFWIHTELITNLGPLEYILNTPSHHRVHHGRNRYCIDKNYAGFLIIFDRMFGTFASESDPIAYGLTHTLETWNPVEIQFFHLRHVWNRFREEKGLSNKLKAIFYGPGWTGPASARLGSIEDIPDIHPPVSKLRTKASTLESVYVLIHFLLVNGLFLSLLVNKHLLSQLYLWLMTAYLLWGFTNFGLIFDSSKYALASEQLRLIATPVILSLVPIDDFFARSLSRSAILSLGFWLWQRRATMKAAPTSDEGKKRS